MRFLILSDIHGNLPALEYVLRCEKGVDAIVSLGDVVNYGPWSNECVDLLDTLSNKILIKGNHEEAFIVGVYPGQNEVAKAFFNFCYPTFYRKKLISEYVKLAQHANFEFAHTIEDRYIYPDTELELISNIFIGHSHRMFKRVINNHRLINVGSVGQNRINIDEINYVLWEPLKDKIDLIAKKFSSNGLISEMVNKNYPEICVNYIKSKRIFT